MYIELLRNIHHKKRGERREKITMFRQGLGLKTEYIICIYIELMHVTGYLSRVIRAGCESEWENGYSGFVVSKEGRRIC